MAYNPVPTVATGDPWSAANANTYWRDNFAAGVPDIFTAAGQLAYATGADAAAALAAGAARTSLRMNAGASAPEWGGAIACGVSRVANQAIGGSGASASISWDQENYDTDAFFAIGSPTYLSLPLAGFYLVSVLVNWAYNTGGTYRRLLIAPSANSGSVWGSGSEINAAPSGTNTNQLVTGIIKVPSDVPVLLARLSQDSGGNINITAEMNVVFLGP